MELLQPPDIGTAVEVLVDVDLEIQTSQLTAIPMLCLLLHLETSIMLSSMDLLLYLTHLEEEIGWTKLAENASSSLVSLISVATPRKASLF